jgi:NAD(P)-dependent dehydrogenase (short-subunit alcohol dehydrogenase family)
LACFSYVAIISIAVTKCAAVDLAPDGIRVNAVNPGVVRTPLQVIDSTTFPSTCIFTMIDYGFEQFSPAFTNFQKRGGMSDEAYEKFLAHSVQNTHPLAQSLGRVAEPEEVGDLIAFLVSDHAKFITGDNIKIDGGRGCLGRR